MRRLVRTWLGALSLLAAGAPALGAQRVWRSTLYPYVFYSTADGLWAAAHYGVYSPLGFAERPEPNAAALNFDAGASLQGSYSLTADLQAPALWNGWRLGLTLTAARDNRLGFYGLGNETAYDADSAGAAAPYFYKVSRTHAGARVTLARRVIGPLRVLVGATLERTNFRILPGPSVFRESEQAGTVDSTAIPFTDHTVRAGVVIDTRDNELAPHSGIFVEGLFASGKGYTRTTGAVRLFVHPTHRLVIAGRLDGEGMGGNPPLATQLVMESSERPFVAVGGYYSLRGYDDARFVGPGKLLGGLEVRYAPVWAPSVLELTLVGFYDAARVFGPGERFRVTTDGLHRGGGVELALRVLRNSLLVVGVGVGDDGRQFLFATRWSY